MDKFSVLLYFSGHASHYDTSDKLQRPLPIIRQVRQRPNCGESLSVVAQLHLIRRGSRIRTAQSACRIEMTNDKFCVTEKSWRLPERTVETYRPDLNIKAVVSVSGNSRSPRRKYPDTCSAQRKPRCRISSGQENSVHVSGPDGISPYRPHHEGSPYAHLSRHQTSH